jgi:hypothetical protein
MIDEVTLTASSRSIVDKLVDDITLTVERINADLSASSIPSDLTQIALSADKIYDAMKGRHPSFPHSIRKMILNRIAPLQALVNENNSSNHECVLPQIYYNKEELNEILIEIHMDSLMADEVDLVLNSLFGVLSRINDQTYLGTSKQGIAEAEGITEMLYQKLRHNDVDFSEAIGDVILGWLQPAKVILATPSKNNQLKSKSLYSQQSFLCRNPELHEKLLNHLAVLDNNRCMPMNCFISYVWSNNEEEYWIQNFLAVLYYHLKKAGISPIMDVIDLGPGENQVQFMEELNYCSFIISVGSKSLKDKVECYYRPCGIQTEYIKITRRADQENVYPLLLSGTAETAYPKDSVLAHFAKDERDSYLGLLKSIIDWMYKDGNSVTKELAWSAYQEQHLKYRELNNLTEEIINEEINNNFHRQSVDRIKDFMCCL